MANYLTTRERVKRQVARRGARGDQLIDRSIADASRRFIGQTGRRFIPVTETRYYDWPDVDGGRQELLLRSDLLSLTTLTAGGIAIPSADYFLHPADGPPYWKIEIDSSSASSLQAGLTNQRAIEAAGVWAVSGDTEPAGALAAAISTAGATALDCTNAALIDVGDTLLIDTERLFVSDRAALTTTATVSGSLGGAQNDVTVVVNDGTKVYKDEVILVDAERMYVTDVVGNNLVVERAYDGTALATHASGAVVYAYRRLTVERGVNGSTAATHALAAAITRYLVDPEVEGAVRAMVIADLLQGEAGWGRAVGADEGAREFSGRDVRRRWQETVEAYHRWTVGGG